MTSRGSELPSVARSEVVAVAGKREQWHLSTPAFRDDTTSRAGAMATVSTGARALLRTAEVTEGP
jgi:hypothetical protein